MTSYKTQMLAKPLVVTAIVLFLFQLTMGFLLASYELNPLLLANVLNFNVIRSLHLNSLLLWIFAATFAAVIYIVPMLSQREMPNFMRFFPWFYIAIAVGILATLPLMQKGYNIWAFNQPLLVEGREFVEAGRVWDILLIVAFAVFGLGVLRTLPSVRKWSIPIWALVSGGVFGLFIYIPGNIFFADFPTSEFFRWWTIHYWVELALEVAYVAAIGLVLIFMIRDPRVKGIVGKYVFYDAILATVAGIVGNGHHYFWIGTPDFWILLGGLIGTLEVVPLALMIMEVYKIASALHVENKPAFYHITGAATLGFVGAAMLGMSQNWPWTNWWEHGTWVTPAHGHLGFFAFAFGAVALVFFITPDLAGRRIDATFEKYGKLSFWFMLFGILTQALAFGFGGIIQIFYDRVLAADWIVVFTQRAQLGPLLAFGGMMTFMGVVIYAGVILRHFYFPPLSGAVDPITTGGTAVAATAPPTRAPNYRNTTFFSTLEGFPLLVIFGFIFSSLVAIGIWSFSSTFVLDQLNPTVPYVLSAVGYLGLAATAVLMALKLIRGVEHESTLNMA